MTNNGSILAISVSDRKGIQKNNVDEAVLRVSHGIEGDAHAGTWHRQVSLLAQESIDKMVEKGLKVKGGDFAENITTKGVDIPAIPVGARIRLGNTRLVVSQIGKVCHNRCAIFYAAGDCVMPREGIFAEVIDDGRIKVGDSVVVEPKNGFSVGIITLSDRASQGVYEDKTSPAIDEYIRGKFNISYIRKELLPDEVKRLEMVLTDFADTQQFDLIITNGSTGVSPRDIAPEGILSVITKRLNGFEEIMRFESYKKTPHAIISRAVCGIRKNSLILSVPGSPKAAVENLEAVIRAVAHAIAKIQGDTSTCG